MLKFIKITLAIFVALNILIENYVQAVQQRNSSINLTKTNTIPHLTIGTYGACQTLIKPASAGTGVIAGSSIRLVLELAGVKNILAKQLGTNNVLNNARATIAALLNLRTLKNIANERDLPIEHFIP
jgi:small subunit ribosomal protein S5